MNEQVIKEPENMRIAVAMSGGVDSSVVAALLKEQGYDVIGITLHLHDEASGDAAPCSTESNIAEACHLAATLNFPHHVIDSRSAFNETVVTDFIKSYLQGETPVPCAKCNREIKFDLLVKAAKELGAQALATGHYVQRIINPDTKIAELWRGVDPVKDQSWFLFATPQEQLDFLRFPLGGWEKDVTREHAQRFGLLNAAKPDSQGICFVPDGDYASFVARMRPEAIKAGDITDMSGNVLGTHSGLIHYTIGQRKGLGIGGGISEDNEPFYVVRLDPIHNRVIVGQKEALHEKSIRIKDCNWYPFDYKEKEEKPVLVKIRSMMAPVRAHLIKQDDNTALIIFDEPQFGIAPGQAAVCYEESRVLGGGWIAKGGLSEQN